MGFESMKSVYMYCMIVIIYKCFKISTKLVNSTFCFSVVSSFPSHTKAIVQPTKTASFPNIYVSGFFKADRTLFQWPKNFCQKKICFFPPLPDRNNCCLDGVTYFFDLHVRMCSKNNLQSMWQSCSYCFTFFRFTKPVIHGLFSRKTLVSHA